MTFFYNFSPISLSCQFGVSSSIQRKINNRWQFPRESMRQWPLYDARSMQFYRCLSTYANGMEKVAGHFPRINNVSRSRSWISRDPFRPSPRTWPNIRILPFEEHRRNDAPQFTYNNRRRILGIRFCLADRYASRRRVCTEELRALLPRIKRRFRTPFVSFALRSRSMLIKR